MGGESQKKLTGQIKAKIPLLIITSAICILLLAVLIIPLLSGKTALANIAVQPFNFFNIILILAVIAAVSLMIIISRFFSSLELINSHANMLASGELNISDIRLDKTKGLLV